MVRTRRSLPPERDESADSRGRPGRARLNLLLSYGGWRQTPAEEQLARLLAPLGINSITAESGEEAADIMRRVAVHIAVVDLLIPLHRRGPATAPGGGRILQLLRRLDQPPPTVLVRPPQPASRESARQLSEALREGAFAVLDRPFRLETMLEVMRRVLRRYYADLWPDSTPSP
jgi:CheY-like chemotaxis protein